MSASSPIEPCALPDGALLSRYRANGGYTDCYATEISGTVSQAQYVQAFYTTPLFKLERAILKFAVAMPSTDAQAGQLAEGSIKAFAAWRVEARSDNQLLMCDFRARTRSWLMAEPTADGARTRLYFGSAVVPVGSAQNGKPGLGLAFRLLLGFHKLYSAALLRAARSRIEKTVA